MRISQTKALLLFLLTLSAEAFSGRLASKSSDLFAKISTSIAFTEDLLPELGTSDSISKATSLVQGSDGSTYVTGNIEVTNAATNHHSFATNEPDDQLGKQDMFLLKLADDGTKMWSKRFGSPGADEAKAIAIDADDNIYISGSVGSGMGDLSGGGVIFKYHANSSRLWVKTFGSNVARDTLNGIELIGDSTELIAAGTIGSRSTLHTDDTRRDGFAVVIVRVSAKDGTTLNISVGDQFDDSVGSLGNALAVKVANGTGLCFVAGYSVVKSGLKHLNNAAIYAFSYPKLGTVAKRQVSSQTIDSFIGVATSLNKFSVFAVGKQYMSVYAQDDALVTRFNASNLATGWSKTLGSNTFPDRPSIVSGAVSEVARDVVVDEFGNLYVLLEASGPVGDQEEQEGLSNKRTAVVVFAPDGTVVHTVQSTRTQTTSSNSMIVHGGNLLIGGWTIDETTLMPKLYLSGVALPEKVYARHGSEKRPSVSDGDDGVGDDLGPRDTHNSSNVGVIAGAAGGGAALICAVAAGAWLGVRARKKRGVGASPV